jgi:hypothetical protein
VGAGSVIGRIATNHWTLRTAIVVALVAAGVMARGGTARAADGLPGAGLGAQIGAEVSGQIDQAMAISNAAVAQAQTVVPRVDLTSTTSDAEATTQPVPTSTAPAQVEAPAEPAARPLHSAPKPQHVSKPRHVSQHRSRATPQVRERFSFPSAASGGGSRLEASAPSSGELARPKGATRATPHRARPSARPAPRPSFPFAPPTPGGLVASAAGTGGGPGAFPAPSPAALAGFLLIVLSLFLRSAVWSAWSPERRVALPPWRPG